MTSTRRNVRVRRYVLSIVGCLITGIMLFPLYWMVNSAFEDTSQIVSIPPIWFPLHGTLSGFRSAIASQGGHLLISLAVAGGTALLTVALAVPASFALAKFRIPGSRAVVFTLIIVQMIPSIAMANAFYSVASKTHLLDTYPALVLADSTLALPFCAIILRAFFVSIPNELIEAARVDGAGYPRIIMAILVPLGRNAIITSALFAFLFSWGDFLYALTLEPSGAITPVTVGLYRFIGAYTTQWNAITATAVLTSIPAAALLIIAQRYISAGITAGAVKD